jgi:hypothetical protein
VTIEDETRLVIFHDFTERILIPPSDTANPPGGIKFSFGVLGGHPAPFPTAWAAEVYFVSIRKSGFLDVVLSYRQSAISSQLYSRHLSTYEFLENLFQPIR